MNVKFRPFRRLKLHVRRATNFLSSRTFDKNTPLLEYVCYFGREESPTYVAGGLELLYVGGHLNLWLITCWIN